MSLATKYRPNTFTDVKGQDYIVDILQYQLETGTTKSSYLFIGPAGCGKTTVARILAKELNGGKGQPIEIDAASNNGVDDVRNIIEQSTFKSITTDYKVFILDECHMLSINAWNALLKLLEEPPINTVFILCTTDPQKIPATIFSRVQRYDFKKISTDLIINGLKTIIEAEKLSSNIEITFEDEAFDYIAKLANGGMRDSITLLEKCLDYSSELSIDNVINCLGIVDYDDMLDLTELLITNNVEYFIKLIESLYNEGKDLRIVVKNEIEFIVDVIKYDIVRDLKYTQIPSIYEEDIINILDAFGTYKLYNILDELVKLQSDIKYDTNPKMYIQGKLLLFMKEN